MELACNYRYLSANECEQLKESVKDREQDFTWGTFGPDKKDGDELERYSIDKLSTQHLENIPITQCYINIELRAAILMLLKKRYDLYGAIR